MKLVIAGPVSQVGIDIVMHPIAEEELQVTVKIVVGHQAKAPRVALKLSTAFGVSQSPRMIALA
jgi:hypothetical protein